jgi:hypothetical protein
MIIHILPCLVNQIGKSKRREKKVDQRRKMATKIKFVTLKYKPTAKDINLYIFDERVQ